jgi:branched-chain amino acid transport system ATP-binding protein
VSRTAEAETTRTVLELQSVELSYGAVAALRSISLTVREGEVVALLGANGAGKTSTLRAVSRTVPLTGGSVRFEGADISRLAPHQVVAAGISHAPEGRRIFPDLTVMENLEVGAFTVRDRRLIAETRDRVLAYFPVLSERARQKGGTLSGGEQQMLAVARALMSGPRLLMLDEPSLGLAPMVVERIFEIIDQINREEGVAIFLVEQNANEALQHADRAYILENGSITMCGEAAELRDDERVRAAYLGG